MCFPVIGVGAMAFKAFVGKDRPDVEIIADGLGDGVSMPAGVMPKTGKGAGNDPRQDDRNRYFYFRHLHVKRSRLLMSYNLWNYKRIWVTMYTQTQHIVPFCGRIRKAVRFFFRSDDDPAIVSVGEPYPAGVFLKAAGGSNPSLSANVIATVPSLWLGIFYDPTASRACSGEREGNKKPHEV